MPSNHNLLIAASTVWVVVTAVLVMFMQAGFALLEAGLCRMKNAAHIAGKNVLIFGIASIVYWAVGFGIAFGDGGSIVGTAGFFPSVHELVADEEREHRLRQEAGLEHPAAVLVRDPALASVPDRFDHRHAYMSGRLLDRVDHGLDPFPDHHRLHLDHPLTPSSDQQKAPGAHGS